jgi:HlyD family secretion protein
LRGKGKEDIPVSTTTAEVTEGEINRQIFVTGTLHPERTVDVGSQVSGTIQTLEADFNASVRRGQVIARLDPSRYQTELVEAQGKLAQAQANQIRLRAVLDDVRAKLARAEDLVARDLIPQTEFEAAQLAARQAAAELKAAEADGKAAEATVNQARVSLNHTIIRSPIDGIVVNRAVDTGQTIAASVQAPVLFSIADLGRMELLAEISEADVGGVRPGAVVTFQVESIGEQPFEGTVSEVRLQPVVQATAASGSTPSNAAATGTSGAAGPTAGSGRSSASSTTQGQSTSTGSTTGASGRQPAPSTPSTGSSSTAAPSASAGTSAGAQSTAGGTGGPGIVNYTAVIAVSNDEGRLTPGGTALITLNAEHRRHVVRIPNSALTFRPSPDVLAVLGQEPPDLREDDGPDGQTSRAGTRRTHVWKFENRRFVPVPVEIGVADDNWTELVSGPLRPQDQLVTAAVPGNQQVTARPDRPSIP